MKTVIFNLQVVVSNISNSVEETHTLITEVQSRLGNIHTETSEKMISLESKVTKIDKSVMGYIDGRISGTLRAL